MKKMILIFCLLLQITAVSYANQTEKWQILEKADTYEFYFDKESVYQDEEGIVSFWLKYVPISEDALNVYRPAVSNYVEELGGNRSIVSEQIYCVYLVEIDFEEKLYLLDQHYWYNSNDDSFITSYKSSYDAQEFTEESDMGKNFLYVKENILHKAEN